MSREFVACRQEVHNRGAAPVAFLDTLVDWGIAAPASIFETNAKAEIYSSVQAELGPWDDNLARRAAMLEVLRVLGGFESSWRWEAGRDTTNPSSNTACTEEAGLFQCSGNSMGFDASLKALLLAAGGDGSCESFKELTKTNHRFAIEYCARLLRFTVNHHGPIKHGHIHPWLRRDAMEELLQYLRQP